MKIAILGAGFTGLVSALRLVESDHQVTVFEKEASVGGLAAGFKKPDWGWSLDKTYHHLFTNDSFAINLAKEVGINLIKKRPKTDVLVNNQILPFDSPLSLLKFPHLPLTDRLRVGFLTFYLKYLSSLNHLESKAALPWLKKYMGEKATNLIWEPLFFGKFGERGEEIALSWFWARIKKRTPSLIYPEGGFQVLAEKLAERIISMGGQIILNAEISQINQNLTLSLARTNPARLNQFDKIIVTLPTSVFIKITPDLAQSYTKKISTISHLIALNLILVLKKSFLPKGTYWLNITDKSFPFLVLCEHTNFMDKKHYANQHILYIGNYLPENHPYLKMSPAKLLKVYDPFLKQINSGYQPSTISYQLFSFPNAQPIVTPNYPKYIPEAKTPIPNLYLANLDMVYPWDRGVNYAIDLGEKIAKICSQND